MSEPRGRDIAEALAALERLHRQGILGLEEAREAGRLITGDSSFDLPSAPAADAPSTPAPDVRKGAEDKPASSS